MDIWLARLGFCFHKLLHSISGVWFPPPFCLTPVLFFHHSDSIEDLAEAEEKRKVLATQRNKGRKARKTLAANAKNILPTPPCDREARKQKLLKTSAASVKHILVTGPASGEAKRRNSAASNSVLEDPRYFPFALAWYYSFPGVLQTPFYLVAPPGFPRSK